MVKVIVTLSGTGSTRRDRGCWWFHHGPQSKNVCIMNYKKKTKRYRRFSRQTGVGEREVEANKVLEQVGAKDAQRGRGKRLYRTVNAHARSPLLIKKNLRPM